MSPDTLLASTVLRAPCRESSRLMSPDTAIGGHCARVAHGDISTHGTGVYVAAHYRDGSLPIPILWC